MISKVFLYRTGFGRQPAVARLGIGPIRLPCRIGRAGVTHHKREGDGATPAGVLRAVRGFWRFDRLRRPRTLVPLRPTRSQDGWCDAVGHARYNRLVRKPFAASHEDLMREDGVYDIVLELDWNRVPRRQGRGSAIFLHLTNAAEGPTAGCIAVPRQKIGILLAMISPRTGFIVR